MSEEILSIKEPELVPLEKLLAQEKASIRKNALWEIGFGAIVVFLHVAIFAYLQAYQAEFVDEIGELFSWKILFRSIFFIFGLIAVLVGIWGLYRSSHLTVEDIVPSAEVVEFLEQAEYVKPCYTYVLVGCISAVALIQMVSGVSESISIAGFAKQDFVGKGEYWRILTGATLHAGFLHFYFNIQALYGIGQMIEQVSNRAHLSIIFLLAILGGGLCSFVFMPTGLPSVGASGGIMGLIGYLAVFGRRRRHHLPPGFFKNMIVNIILTGAIGIIGYQFIDNFAHLGGLLVGAAYGFFQVPSDPLANVRASGGLLKVLGVVALAIFVSTCIFSVSVLLQII